MLANKQSKSCEGPVVASQALNNSQQLSATLNNSQHLSTRFPMSWFLRIQSKKCNNRKQTFHVCEGPLVVGRSVTVLKSLNLLSMKLQIKCLRIQLEKTGKQTVLLCASPLVENANWWDLNFAPTKPQIKFLKIMSENRDSFHPFPSFLHPLSIHPYPGMVRHDKVWWNMTHYCWQNTILTIWDAGKQTVKILRRSSGSKSSSQQLSTTLSNSQQLSASLNKVPNVLVSENSVEEM